MIGTVFHTMNPLLKAVLFGCLTLVTITIASGLGLVSASYICGIPLETLQEMVTAGDADWSVCTLRVMNSINQLCGFLGAALLFGAFFGSSSVNRFMLRMPPAAIWLVPLLTLFSFSLIMASYELNGWLIPEGGWIEQLAQPMEQQAEQMTYKMLEGSELSTLFLNLFLVALLPGICEEMVFRGVLQPLIAKSARNVHIGVWVSAFLFSAIHFQFYGFIPRLLLGVYFGYLVIHMGSLWPAILAHFLNNAAAVIGHYTANTGITESVDQVESQTTEPLALITSVVFFSLFFWVVLQKSKWPQWKEKYLATPMVNRAVEEISPAPDPEEK